MKLEDISAYILSYNEKENIARCIDAISWVPRIILVDSFSSDGTQVIASRYPNVEVVERVFDNLCNQHSHGLALLSGSPWVLRLDSDWIVTPELRDEILGLNLNDGVSGVSLPFRLAIHGNNVPISLYPPVIALFRPASSSYIQDGHTERLITQGGVYMAKNYMVHDDRKPVDRYILSQIRYSAEEASKATKRHALLSANKKSQLVTRLKYLFRSTPGLAPLSIFIYLGLVRGGIFRGDQCRHYVFQRLIAELIVALRILDERIRKNG